MTERKKMKNRYRFLSLVSDLGGIRSTIGEMRGLGHPKQPRLNKNFNFRHGDPVFDEEWFIRTIREKIEHHPDNSKEYPFFGERVFDAPLVDFIRGDDKPP